MASWNLLVALDSFLVDSDLSYFSNTLEVLRDGAWIAVVIRILGMPKQPAKLLPEFTEENNHFYLVAVTVIFFVVLLIMTVTKPLLSEYSALFRFNEKFILVGFMSISICGVMLVEQVLRNSRESNLWHIKFFCLSLVAIFGYDIIMYSHGILVAGVEPQLWQARGIVTAVLAPLIAMSAVRNLSQSVNINLSHSVAFHTGALLIIGIYLIVMSIAGYYIRIFGGDWGAILQTLLIFSSLVGLITIISSGSMRAKLAVYISRNFFNYKYDYRDEWISLTNKLSRPHSDITTYEQAILCIADLVESTGGGLWLEENKHLKFLASAHLNLETAPNIAMNSSLSVFLVNKEWIIDIPEYRNEPSKYENLSLDSWFLDNDRAWLIVPLMLQNQLLGFVFLTEPRTPMQLNWEDNDLLKVIARQVASFLSQKRAGEALSRAKQFEAVNQMSAFLVHDLKTMIAQLSLLVSNAEKHKHNPVFIDDMIKTTDHTVKKMNDILQKLKNEIGENPDNGQQIAEKTTKTNDINVIKLLQTVLNTQSQNQPEPTLTVCDPSIFITMDPDKFTSAIGHIIQNAQDATDNEGFVKITVEKNDQQVKILIEDSGSGMTPDFIKNHLFRPFQSTKGLVGMGIGAFQSREYCREAGGDLTVTSVLGEGSRFTMLLPLVTPLGQSLK